MTGSMTINIIITFGAIALALLVITIVTYPELPVLPFTLALIAVAVFLPLLLHPSTCTMWSAVDLAMRPLENDEAACLAPGYPRR